MIIKSERGSAAIVTLLVAGALGVAILGMLKTGDRFGHVIKDSKDWANGQLMLDKAKSIAGYMVSSNLILCKEDPFANDTETHKCKWAGKQIKDGEYYEIAPETMGITNMKYDEKGFLIFDLNTLNILKGLEYKENEVREISKIKGKLSFKLINLLDEKNKVVRDKLGDIPKEHVSADRDNTVVIVKVEIESKTNLRNTLKSYSAFRRPIAIPEIKLQDVQCKMACAVGVTQDENPACRDSQRNAKGTEVAFVGKTINKGPGVLYRLTLEKRVKFDRALLPNTITPPSKAVNAMPSRDYLLPGESVEWSDSIACPTIERTVMVTTRNRGTGGIQKSISQHQQPSGKVEFALDLNAIGGTVQKKEIYHTVKNECNEMIEGDWKTIKTDEKCEVTQAYQTKKGQFSFFNCTEDQKYEVSCYKKRGKRNQKRVRECRVCSKRILEHERVVRVPNDNLGFSDIEPSRVAKRENGVEDNIPLNREDTVIIRVISSH